MLKERTVVLLIVALLFGFPMCLIQLHHTVKQSVSYNEAMEILHSEGRECLNEVYRGADNEIQIRRWLEIFQSQASELIRLTPPHQLCEAVTDLYRRSSPETLPPHDLALAWFDSFRNRLVPLVEHSGGMGFVPDLSAMFLRGLLYECLDPSQRPEFDSRIRQCLHFPGFVNFFDRGFAMNLHFFNSFQAKMGFYTQMYPNRLTHIQDLQNVLTAVFDLERIPPDFWLGCLLRSWNQPNRGLAFLHLDGSKPILSDFFGKNPNLAGFLADPSLVGAVSPRFLRHGHVLFFLGDRPLQGKFLPVIILPAPIVNKEDLVGPNTLAAAGTLFLLLGFFSWFRYSRTGRLPRLAVAGVLGGVFLATMVPAVGGMWAISQIIVSEQRKLDIGRVEKDLQRQLRECDDQCLAIQATIIDSLRKLMRNPQTPALIKAALDSTQETNHLKKLVGNFSQSLPWKSREGMNGFMVAIGPAGQARGYQSLREGMKQSGEFLQLLFPVGEKSWDNLFHHTQSEAKNGTTGMNKALSQGVKFEMIRDVLFRTFGVGEFLRITNLTHQLIHWNINLGQLYLMVLPSVQKGFPPYLVNWGWDEGLLSGPVETSFKSRSFTASEAIFWVYSREKSLKALPIGIEGFPELADLAQRARDTVLPQKRLLRTPHGDRVLAAIHSRYLTQNQYAGERLVDDSSGFTQLWFSRTLLGLFALILILAFFAVRFFMVPFRAILTALRQIQPGVHHIRLPDAERNDEFGTLARALLEMQQGLREKELLGKFVTGSVRRLVQDDSFRRAAEAGMNRDITVMFSGLAGFSEFQATASPAEVYGVLNEHLSAMTEIAAEKGGEVSKVIGDKLMLIFDHESFPSHQAAAESAIETALALRQRLGSFKLSPITGVTSGQAIAGILGSETVRRDYTVVGDTVNLAARLAVLANIAEGTKLIISGETLKLIGKRFSCEKLPFKRVKGKTREVEAFLVHAS
jgi:class 3 adenylate cyclase